MSAFRHAVFVTALLACAALPLVACAPMGETSGGAADAPSTTSPIQPEQAPQPAPGLDGNCDAQAAQAYVGKTASAEVAAQARTAAGADTVRTLKPGQMVTMEFSAGRLNLDVDASNVITAARCG